MSTTMTSNRLAEQAGAQIGMQLLNNLLQAKAQADAVGLIRAAVVLAGTLKPGAWIDREGNARPQVDMVAAQVLTPYSLKKKRERSAAAVGDAPHSPQAGPAGDDFGRGDTWLSGGDAS
jgi:hypothetical protein